jgi:N-acetylglucosaminyl-diphospho-decaprenol L-rhamnosyltransferase
VTIHVLMPVFNRLAMTQAMLAYLRVQQVDEALSIVVIDDGSTDGTSEFLKTQGDIAVIRGDGSLWWGGAIDAGLRQVLTNAADDDWVLLVNNDTHIEPDFVQGLLTIASNQAPAAVGSAIRDLQPPHRLLSVGPHIDAWYFRVRDMPDAAEDGDNGIWDIRSADALSGRGVIYPVAALRAVHGMRPRWLPHYLADYELAIRVRCAGWQLHVSPAVAVRSQDQYGNAYRGSTLWERLFSVRSPSYLPAQVRFWWEASNFWQRLTLPLRLALFILFPSLRKNK